VTARLVMPDQAMRVIQCEAKARRDVALLHGNPDALFRGLQEILGDEGIVVASAGARAYLRSLAKLLQDYKP
jgi:hypothetical protein